MTSPAAADAMAHRTDLFGIDLARESAVGIIRELRPE